MKTLYQISTALLMLIFISAGIVKANKPADRTLIISRDGRIIEIFSKPEKLVTESEFVSSLIDGEKKDTIQQKDVDFDITYFIKPEKEINDLDLDTYTIFRKIKALDAQIK